MIELVYIWLARSMGTVNKKNLTQQIFLFFFNHCFMFNKCNTTIFQIKLLLSLQYIYENSRYSIYDCHLKNKKNKQSRQWSSIHILC